jgi:NAD(P)-dependent dehydrogenase (short-subunit alcohol dehydrogenase family)
MRNWFITGVSSGLGRALADAALAAGDTVVGTVRKAAAAAEFGASPTGRAHGRVLDVTDGGAVASVVAEAERVTGGLDIVLNNAGYSLSGTTEEASLDDLRAQFETNFFGAVEVIKAALPFLRGRRRGHIINVGSLAGYVAPGGFAAYSATKMALASFSDALRQELEPFNIGVMMVVPGAFRTRLGHSRVSIPTSIADYREQNAARDGFLKHFSDNQRGDPVKAAAAVMTALGETTPPRTLLLGPDAVDGVLGGLAALRQEIERWEALSRGTDLA